MSELDNAGLWFARRNTEIQDYKEPEEVSSFVDVDVVEELTPEVTNKELRTSINMTKLNEPTAKIVTSLMDVILPMVLVLFVKGTDKEQIKLDDEEKDTLTQAWAAYLKEIDFDISPGGILVTTILTIYGAKITVAMMDRKQKDQEIDAIREQNKLLRKSLKTAEKQDTKK